MYWYQFVQPMVVIPNTFTDPCFVELMANWDGGSNKIVIDLGVHEFWFSLQCLSAAFEMYLDIAGLWIMEFTYTYEFMLMKNYSS